MCWRSIKIVQTRNTAGSPVGIATELRAGRSGIESRWGRDFPPVQTGPGAHPASCRMGTGSLPGVEAAGAWGWPPPHLECRSPRKSRAIPLLTLRAFVAYKRELETYLSTKHEATETFGLLFLREEANPQKGTKFLKFFCQIKWVGLHFIINVINRYNKRIKCFCFLSCNVISILSHYN